MIDNSVKVSSRIFGLDLLRSLSIFLVVFSHTSWIYPSSEGLLAKVKDMSGFFGVELFFVISGFLVGGIIYRQFVLKQFDLRDIKIFLSRRLIRVLPSYYLAIAINVVIYLFYGFSVTEVWRFLLLIQNIYTPIPLFFTESWSLPIKELGYIIAVLGLYLTTLIKDQKSKKLTFLVIIISIILLSFFSKIIYHLQTINTDINTWSLSIRSVVIYRLDSVLLGVLFACLNIEYSEVILRRKYTALSLGIFLLLIFLLCLTVFNFRLDNAAWFWNIYCLPLTSVIIVLFIPFLISLKSAPSYLTKPVEFICNISYSVYLLHYSIILFLMKKNINTLGFTLSQLHLFTVAYLFITILLSYALYVFFEKPINKFRLSNFKFNER